MSWYMQLAELKAKWTTFIGTLVLQQLKDRLLGKQKHPLLILNCNISFTEKQASIDMVIFSLFVS